MTERFTRTSLTFRAPFRLPGYDAPLPAGTYAVDTEEEAIEANDYTVYRRVSTTFLVESGGRIEHRPVDAQALAQVWERDQTAALAPPSDPVAPEPVAPEPVAPKPKSLFNWFRAFWRGGKD